MGNVLREQLRAWPDEHLTLAGFDPGQTIVDKREATEDLADLRDRLAAGHDLLMANKDHAVLLVLQGLDCSGKSGTIKHVVSAMNPVGVRVASFTEPEGDEVDEHFLERIRREVPEPGWLHVFDRSHYEDLFVPTVLDGMTPDEFDERLGEVIEFEQELADAGVTVVKCLLHISYDEQRERLLRRLRRPDKRWKFAESDLDTRDRWDEWQAVYGRAIGRSSTDTAPWLVIPADHKWHRNWAVASILAEVFDELDESYPEPFSDAELERLRGRLTPPN